jgi:hypothetical protein
MPRGITLATLGAALLLASGADAQSLLRCVGKDGRRYYGSTIPQPCIGRLVEELNAQGMVVRRIDPEGEEQERAAKQAEAAKKREQDAQAKEALRRNRALLAIYQSEKDIEERRARALADNDKEVKDIEARIEAIKKWQAGHEKELEFYKGKNQPPARFADDIKNAEIDLKAQEDLLAAKKKEVDGINAKYDEDKRRYRELTGAAPARSVPEGSK